MLAIERVPHKDKKELESGEEGENKRPKKKFRDNVRLWGNLSAGVVDRFADSIREPDDARVALERERLLFEQKRFELETKDCEKERVMRADKLDKNSSMRKDEREAHERMDLENSKLIIEVLSSEQN